MSNPYNKLQSLTSTSSLEEILQVIFYDLKSSDVIDETKFRSKNQYNRLITLDELKQQPVESMKSRENIKNFLRHQIAKNMGILKYNGLQGEQIQQVKFFHESYLTQKKQSKQRNDVDVKNLELIEFNSYETTFTMFMINIVRDKYVWDPKDKKWYVKTYFKEFGVKEHNDIYRDIYFLKNVDGWFKEAIGDDKMGWWKLGRFAYLANTLGNYVLVPSGFGTLQTKKYADVMDYFDLSLLLMNKEANRRFGKTKHLYQRYLEQLDLFGLDVLIKSGEGQYIQNTNGSSKLKHLQTTNELGEDQSYLNTNVSGDKQSSHMTQDSNNLEFGVVDYDAASSLSATRIANEQAAKNAKDQFIGQGMDVIAGKTAADGVYDGVTRAKRKAEHLYETKWIYGNQELILYYEGHDFHFPRPNYYRTFQWRQLMGAMIVTTLIRNIQLVSMLNPNLKLNEAFVKYVNHILLEQYEEQNTTEIKEMISRYIS